MNINTQHTGDAELICVCAEHIANRHAFNARAGEVPLEEDPRWNAYRVTMAAVSAAEPRTLSGLAAKARATKAEATQPDGTVMPDDEVIWAFDLVEDLIRLDDERRQPPEPLPAVLDLGREIVRLSNRHQELDSTQLALRRQGLESREEFSQNQDLERRMQTLFLREEALVDVTVAMRARTLGDVAVMLGLAWRVLDGAFASEYEEGSYERAFKQVSHALLTSLDVVIREAGLDLDEVVGAGTQVFIDREHADLGDEL